MSKFTVFSAAIALAGGLLVTTLAAPQVNAHPKARIKIDIKQGGFIIGGTSGQGVVRYHRRNYPVSISGMRFGAIIGASEANLTGTITNLTSLADVEGSYTSLGASGALGPGNTLLKFRNSSGVYLNLHGVQSGVEMSLDMGAFTIRLER